MSDDTARPSQSASPVARTLLNLTEIVRHPDGTETTREYREKQVRPPHPYGNFAVVSLPTLARIAAEVSVTKGKEMGVRDLRVFLYLLGMVEFANFVPLSVGSIGRALEIDKAHVSRSLRKLVDLGIIVPDRLSDRPGKPRRYYLAPSLVWKGSTTDLDRVHEQERRATSPVAKVRRARRPAVDQWAAVRDRGGACASEQDDPAADFPAADTLPLFGPDCP